MTSSWLGDLELPLVLNLLKNIWKDRKQKATVASCVERGDEKGKFVLERGKKGSFRTTHRPKKQPRNRQ